MKKITAVLVAIGMVFSLSACVNPPPPEVRIFTDHNGNKVTCVLDREDSEWECDD